MQQTIFTVVCSVTWPLNGSEAAGYLVFIKTSLLFCVNQAVLMLTNWHLNEKSREIPSFAFTGQVTKHADSQIPSRARLYYLCISAAICAAFPLGNIVLTFHVPILKYLILERERWFRPVASRCLRLSPLDFILFLTEEPSSPK